MTIILRIYLIMKALFRKNLYLADSDSTSCTQLSKDAYIKKFKSGVLLAKSIGMNPNMFIDSNGFEFVTQSLIINQFFDKKVKNSLDVEDEHFHIYVHIFNNFLEDSYFNISDNKNTNPFLRYYHEKITDNFFFSSYNVTKKELQNDHVLKNQLENRLKYLYYFSKNIYDKYGYELFQIKNQQEDTNQFRISLLENTSITLKNIKSETNQDLYSYAVALEHYHRKISDNNSILTRSAFYKVFEAEEFKNTSSMIIEKIKTDLINITYNSRFVEKGDIFRFQSVELVDQMYSKYFDSYAQNGKMNRLANIYNLYDKLQSQFEIFNLIMNPNEILNYVADKLLDKATDKGVGISQRIANYVIPKTGFLGISESKKLLIGIK